LYTIAVLRANDSLDSWTEILHLSAPTFARSFEHLDGAWYFGLGSSDTDVSPSTGQVLRYTP
ncbi:MAG: hypothetical protein QOE64_2731, partial [Frankiales bacterium]|nr:hypothetical protein [Frankiales bacterium]